MVNFGWNSASILGVFLMVVGAGLYFLRSVRPELSRDYDIFFAAVGLACGGILVFNGWRLDPILQFGQFLLAGSTIFFAVESIRLRGLATEQARRNTPVVDDERQVSRSYRAYREPEYSSDYDQIEPYDEERYEPRQLRGSQEGRPSRRDRYETESRRPRSRPASNGSSPDRPDRSERADRSERPDRSRRSRGARPAVADRYDDNLYPPADAERYSERYDEWGEAYDEPNPRRSRPSARDRDRDLDPRGSRPPQRRPRSSDNRIDTFQDEEPAPYVDYVDYQPLGDRDADEPPAEDYERGRSDSADEPPVEEFARDRRESDRYDAAPDGYDDYDDYDDEDYNPRAGSEY